MKRTNQIEVYQNIASKLVARAKDNVVKVINGQAPELMWNLEDAITEAMKYAHNCGIEEAEAKFDKLMKEFDHEDGTPAS